MAGITVKTLPGRYAKFLTAALGNALVYATVTYGSTNRWVELATAAAVALGVLAVPNTAAPPMEKLAAPGALPPGYPASKPPMQSLPPTAADTAA